MSLDLPHTIKRKPRTNSTDAHGQRTAPGTGAPRTYKGQITPMSPVAAYDDFQVEVDRPFLLFCNVADGKANAIGDTLEFDGVDYNVESDAAIFDGIGPADHASQVLSQVLAT